MNPKISVIIPIFNVARYLCKCINSIINQTYSNLEIILVDDGSTDNCGFICDNYSLKDNRIKVIHKENGGLSDARNTGLDKATGDYVSFIDSDDYINKEFYLTLVNMIIKYNADIAQCEFLKVYENYSNKYDLKSYNDDNITVLSNKEALNNLFNENYVNTVVVWNKIYRRKLFKNIRYPKGKVHEDEYTTYKLLFNAGKIVSTSKKMYYYLQRSNSIMGKGFNIKSLDKLEAYHHQVIFYNDKKLFELADMAKLSFENIIRVSISMTLRSKLDNKNRLFDNLIEYYRKYYKLFKNNSKVSFKKKFIMLMFRYSSKFVIKLLCNIMYLKSKLNSKLSV
ncbi:glycosyltransferase [Clostridium tyrobutyricum]|uniref:glycosyltransferase n=1 Tax=Clostridium tyrobutyricum TaxID=1519 RepID=UPI0003114D1E|nr:glycosyltransferase [Clostridium tyrobutyricum]MEA5007115.1 glycosyltransferase [Clostridium tyrobutyricum]